MPASQPKAPWHHLTPARFLIGLLAVQVVLLLSEWFEWFWVNEQKGWTVLIAVGVVLVAVVVMLAWGLVWFCLRRRFQFGFRSLLAFLLTVSIPLGWFAWEMQRARRQKVAVEGIRELVGRVYFNYEYGESSWRYPVEPAVPARLRRLLGDDFFCVLVSVDCTSTGFGDDDAEHLQGLANLKSLHLGKTQITDDGLAHLERTAKLEGLVLSGTQITDKGLTHLKGMTELELLFLDDTQITDNGLVHLEGLTKLFGLRLDDTRVTKEGVKTLQKALPNCTIMHP
jgi:hypothetical protein